MPSGNDKKGKVIELFPSGKRVSRSGGKAPGGSMAESLNKGDVTGQIARLLADAKPTRSRKKTKSDTGPQVQSITGDHNIQAVAGGDVNINVRRVTRTTVTPPPGSVTPLQVKRIKDQIDRLVERDAAGGVLGGDTKKLYPKWHKMVMNRFSVPSYHCIPESQGDSAIAWLKQHCAMNRSRVRRTDNDSWRNDHYGAIWARASEMGMSKADVYDLVSRRLGKTVLSLKNLGEQDLQRLRQLLIAQR